MMDLLTALFGAHYQHAGAAWWWSDDESTCTCLIIKEGRQVVTVEKDGTVINRTAIFSDEDESLVERTVLGTDKKLSRRAVARSKGLCQNILLNGRTPRSTGKLV